MTAAKAHRPITITIAITITISIPIMVGNRIVERRKNSRIPISLEVPVQIPDDRAVITVWHSLWIESVECSPKTVPL